MTINKKWQTIIHGQSDAAALGSLFIHRNGTIRVVGTGKDEVMGAYRAARIKDERWQIHLLPAGEPDTTRTQQQVKEEIHFAVVSRESDVQYLITAGLEDHDFYTAATYMETNPSLFSLLQAAIVV